MAVAKARLSEAHGKTLSSPLSRPAAPPPRDPVAGARHPISSVGTHAVPSPV